MTSGRSLLSSHPRLNIVLPLPAMLFSLSSAWKSFPLFQDPDQTSHFFQEALPAPRLERYHLGFCSLHILMPTTSGYKSVQPQTRSSCMEPGGTHQLAGALCQAGTDPSSPIATLPGFTSSHLKYLLFWKITPGLLQCKTQDSGAILDPSPGLVPAEGAHEENSGLLPGNHRKGNPDPLSGVGLSSEDWA